MLIIEFIDIGGEMASYQSNAWLFKLWQQCHLWLIGPLNNKKILNLI
jgi:hypothetical protein